MIEYLQAPFIFHTPTNNHSSNKHYILSNLNREDSFVSNDSGQSTTTFGLDNFHIFPQHILKDIVWDPLDQMFHELQFKKYFPSESNLTNIWWNYYQPGQFVEPHKHLDSDFSGIYLLHLEEPNTTVFFQNGDSGTFPLFDDYIHTNHILEGSTIIFPSRFVHYTLPTKTHRYTVIFNINTSIQYY